MSVCDLAHMHRATDTSISAQPLQIFALETIETWTRGDSIPIISTSNQSPIKITIDAYGIRSVVRLCERPEPGFPQSASQHQSASYIVEEIAELSGVQACTKVKSDSIRRCLKHNTYSNMIQGGLLRLQLPQKRKALPIWDTDFPPRLTDCCFTTTLHRRWQRWRTIDLTNVQGITFFYSVGRLWGVFPHVSARSSALSTYQSLPELRQRSMVWIYMPIGPKDKIIAMGTRKNDDGGICFMVCLEAPCCFPYCKTSD